MRRLRNATAALLRTLLVAAVTAGASGGKHGPATEEEPPIPSARTPWVLARSSEGVPLLEAPAQVLPSPQGRPPASFRPTARGWSRSWSARAIVLPGSAAGRGGDAGGLDRRRRDT